MKKTRELLENYPFFFVAIPAFIILHIEKEYHQLISYKFVYVEIISLFIAPFILFGLSLVLLRHLKKSYAYSLILILIFYFFGYAKDTLSRNFPESFVSRYTFLLPALLLIFIISFIKIRNTKSSFKRIFFFTNVLFLVFIIIDAVIIGLKDIKNISVSSGNKSSLLSGYTPCADCNKPDIYYIVFDSYTSSQTLLKEFNYNNYKIDSFLRAKEFYIVNNSKSNYNFTAYSIASCFNLNYLKDISLQKKIHSDDYLPLLTTIYNSELPAMLEKEGYEIINQSIFDFKNLPSQIPEYNIWGFETLYQQHNILKKIDKEIGWLIYSKLAIKPQPYPFRKDISDRDKHDSDAINALDNITAMQETQPRFIYTHILLPHAPFSFDSLGHKIDVSGMALTSEKDKAAYVSQLAYTNSLLQKTVTNIFEKSKRPFVLIIQGDHGFKFFDNEIQKTEFSNLNAIYFPDKNYGLLYDSISNVNTFRVVFNTFFKKNYPLLKDTSFYLKYK
ncbi:MAG: sulfatase-like hydrolase/transferase [Chitinophagaceae bacterium]